jgi:hypothetical protein
VTEDKLTKVRQGQQAEYVSQSIEPYLREVEAGAVARIKAIYREGDPGKAMMIFAAAGELCTLDAIRNRLNAQINAGKSASKELRQDVSPPVSPT